MWLRESVMDNGQEALCDAEAPVWLQKSRLAHTGWEAFPHTGTRGRGGGGLFSTRGQAGRRYPDGWTRVGLTKGRELLVPRGGSLGFV